jgi:hypothetical protein
MILIFNNRHFEVSEDFDLVPVAELGITDLWT